MNTTQRQKLCALLVGAVAFATVASPALAADHKEAPGTSGDPAADIADLYAWHDASANVLTVVLTYDGLAPAQPGTRGTFDEDVLYAFNIDNNGDFVADRVVTVRFEQERRGNGAKSSRGGKDWIMVIENLPGTQGTVSAPVERTTRVYGGYNVFAGLRDDPFFFDLQGFQTTLQTGTLSFDGTRDSFAGMNASAIVLEMDLNDALNGGTALNLWATTARK